MTPPPSLPIDIDVHAVAKLLSEDQSVVLLDCREADELAIAQIDGARHIPMRQIPQSLAELRSAGEHRLVVYCHLGGRSSQVVHWLRQQGIERAQNMIGGIDQWAVDIDASLTRY